ncbi:hypothetical protein, partial [Flavobacterium sp. J372]|uniref:hypothetical protein n=1 Tax=Flavobacterium sp. J372 TaxID=2898436 RepID=UPI0027E29810
IQAVASARAASMFHSWAAARTRLCTGQARYYAVRAAGKHFLPGHCPSLTGKCTTISLLVIERIFLTLSSRPSNVSSFQTGFLRFHTFIL